MSEGPLRSAEGKVVATPEPWNVVRSDSAAPPPPEASGPPPARPKRRVPRWAAVMILLVAVLLVLVLVVYPRVVTSFDRIVRTELAGFCGSYPSCPVSGEGFDVGVGWYATVSGTWNTSTVEEPPAIEISDGAGSLYSSSAPAGSFEVSGTGPFHISIDPRSAGIFYTTVQGTVLTW